MWFTSSLTWTLFFITFRWNQSLHCGKLPHRTQINRSAASSSCGLSPWCFIQILYLLLNWLNQHLCFRSLCLFYTAVYVTTLLSFFFLLQKIENLKETTCVSQNFNTCLILSFSFSEVLVNKFCFSLSEYGRVHQALHCTAANRKGKHKTLQLGLPSQYNHYSC